VANLFPVTTPATFRRMLRGSALAPPLASVLLSPPALAATPSTWGKPAPMSVLEALLIFAGIPLAIILGVTLLVLAPSLVRGDRQQRGVSSWTEPQWFGGPADAVPAGRHSVHGEIGPGERAEQPGGASARW
jgi:hypothetical protein